MCEEPELPNTSLGLCNNLLPLFDSLTCFYHRYEVKVKDGLDQRILLINPKCGRQVHPADLWVEKLRGMNIRQEWRIEPSDPRLEMIGFTG